MIRRKMGDRFFLIAQHEHAMLSGRLAEKFGNARFAPPNPSADTIAAASLHDCGWPEHDDHPTLNHRHQPTDVFESPLSISLAMWSAGPDRAADRLPYTQLLISLHVLGLSAYASSKPRTHQELFELNRFQHRECERQEELRRKLGLSVTTPLYLGLAMKDHSPPELQLKRNHYIIQAMDRISLALCCDQVPAAQVENMVPRPGEAAITLSLTRADDTTLIVDPWPFDAPSLSVSVPYRAVAARAYANERELQAAYDAAAVEQLALTVKSRKM